MDLPPLDSIERFDHINPRESYVALDHSEHSDTASTVALELASAFDARIIGTHVYAARMHDYWFKQMEYTLPKEYQDEAELLRQRRIHDSLITTGLEPISDSYTDVLRFRCLERGVPFSARRRDGCSIHLDPGRSGVAILVYRPVNLPTTLVWGRLGDFVLCVPVGGALPPLAGALHAEACTPPAAPPA
jgi:hypothetical protein